MKRFVEAAIILIILAGCAKVSLAPLHYDSYCRPDTAPDLAAIRRVAATVEDGPQYRLPSGPFSARPKRYLGTFGGVVATWKPSDFDLPDNVANNRKVGFDPFALAIPDDGAENGGHRVIFLAFKSRLNPDLETWTPQTSSDRENTCK